jgi:hypothetical protein
MFGFYVAAEEKVGARRRLDAWPGPSVELLYYYIHWSLYFQYTYIFPECVARVPVSLWGSGG